VANFCVVEGTDPHRAEELRLIDNEINERRKAVKNVRDEIEQERKTQDATLKDVRHFNAETRETTKGSSKAGTSASTGGSGISKKAR
jgi:hypothetical protein